MLRTPLCDRVLRNAFTEAWDGRGGELEQHRDALRRALDASAQRQDAQGVDVSAGVAVGLVHTVESASSIVHALVGEAARLLRRSGGEAVS